MVLQGAGSYFLYVVGIPGSQRSKEGRRLKRGEGGCSGHLEGDVESSCETRDQGHPHGSTAVYTTTAEIFPGVCTGAGDMLGGVFSFSVRPEEAASSFTLPQRIYITLEVSCVLIAWSATRACLYTCF